MAKWIIRYNYGYGDMIEEVEADTETEATNAAYEMCREDAETQFDWEAMTPERALEEGYIDPDDEDED